MSKLPKEWKEVNLVDCLESLIDYRGKTPKKSDEGILTLSAKSVKMGYIDYNQAYYISQETYDKFMMRGFPKKGDVLMTTEAPLGCIAKLDRDDISVAQRLLTLRGKEGILDNDYLLYYLTSKRGQYELNSRASGSTVQGIKRSEFEYVNIVLPSTFEEQKEIANIIASFDLKIKLLQEQNKTLESIAQNLFKELFINNKKDTWEEKKLGDFISVKHGFAFQGKYISTEKNENILVTPGNFKIGGGFKSSKFKYYQSSEFPSDYILKEDDLIITLTDLSKSCDTLGYPALVPNCNDNYLHNQRIGKVIFELDINKYFLYFLLRTRNYQQYIVGASTGSTVNHTSPTTICNFVFLLPENNLIDEFSVITKTLLEKQKNNSTEIETLNEIKKTLLPRLISGKIRVEGYGK